MTHYQFLSIVVIAAFGSRSCYTQTPLTQDTTKFQESTPLSFEREIEENSRYKTLEANATVLKLLVNDKGGVSSSEVLDMLHSRDEDQEHVDLPSFPEDAEDSRLDVPALPDLQTEFLQASGNVVFKDSDRIRSYSAGEPVGLAAGIMIVVTLGFVCLGYITFIVWRRIYLKRNGLKHELLRNEEHIAETRIEL